MAKPAPDQPMDAPVLRETSAYRFSTLEMDSSDGQRHYRIWIGKPPQPTAASPVAYLLDGNAAIAALDVDGLNRLTKRPSPPILIAVGYATQLRIDRASRTFDYTPVIRDAAQQRDPLTDLPSGGADAFLDFLTLAVRPIINQQLGLTPGSQMIWGHSYAGLLVLHALMTRPDAFDVYAAASPSLWWQEGVLERERQGLEQRLKNARPTLLLMRGELEPARPGAAPMPAYANAAAANTLLSALRPIRDIDTRYTSFPGLGHGPMLQASLREALDYLSQGSAK